MKTPREILLEVCPQKNAKQWDAYTGYNKELEKIVIEAMERYTEQKLNKHSVMQGCQCKDRIGETKVWCCNQCGLPCEDGWLPTYYTVGSRTVGNALKKKQPPKARWVDLAEQKPDYDGTLLVFGLINEGSPYECFSTFFAVYNKESDKFFDFHGDVICETVTHWMYAK